MNGQGPNSSRLLRYLSNRFLTVVLLVALVFSLMILIPKFSNYALPGNQRGYEPAQPIAFSHRLHAGDLQVQCLYCHSGAEKSRHAGIPSTNVCMNCHRFVSATLGAVRAEDEAAKKEKRDPARVVSPEIQKIYDALALNDRLQLDPAKQPKPINWIKVHNLPDFVYFDHRPHVNAGVACQKCHGSVETMERVRQVEDLSMGWCVNCHRGVDRAGLDGNGNFTSAPAPAAYGPAPVTRRVYASIDCSTCHY
jgi:hypothetical protein